MTGVQSFDTRLTLFLYTTFLGLWGCDGLILRSGLLKGSEDVLSLYLTDVTRQKYKNFTNLTKIQDINPT